MIQRAFLTISLFLLALGIASAQHQYYKNPDSTQIRPFKDSLNRVVLLNADSNSILKNQIAYVLKFFPKMVVKNIVVEFKESIHIARTTPRFNDILKSPDQRVYRICFSNSTKSTLDSVMINELSFNSQLGLIAREISQVEELSTDGFLDHVAWYFRQLSRRGRNRIVREAEAKALEAGLGYQLLSFNLELSQKLNIDRWKSVKGYATYVKYTKTPAMKPYLINDFINDLPVYVKQAYK